MCQMCLSYDKNKALRVVPNSKICKVVHGTKCQIEFGVQNWNLSNWLGSKNCQINMVPKCQINMVPKCQIDMDTKCQINMDQKCQIDWGPKIVKLIWFKKSKWFGSKNCQIDWGCQVIMDPKVKLIRVQKLSNF